MSVNNECYKTMSVTKQWVLTPDLLILFLMFRQIKQISIVKYEQFWYKLFNINTLMKR